MTTTSATAGGARFIGRVGALAVALGIGVAVANSPAIAAADTGGSDPSGSSAGASDSTKSQSSTPQRGPRKPGSEPGQGLAKRLRDVTSKVESALDDAKSAARSGVKLNERKAAAGNRKSAAGESGTTDKIAADHARQVVSRAVTKTDDPAPERATPDARPQESADTEVITPVEALANTVKAVTNHVADQAVAAFKPRTEAAPAHVVPQLVASVVSSERLNPLSPDLPVNPAHDIGLAALLGWSRREGQPSPSINLFDRSQETEQVESTVTSTEVTAGATSTLATEEQLAAEREVTRIVNTPAVQLAKVVLMAAWYAEALRNFSAVGGPDLTNLSQLHQAASEFANQSATQFLMLDSNDPKLLLQVNPPRTWNGQEAGGTRIWYDNPDTVYRFTGINGASTYKIEGKVQGYDPNDPTTHPTSSGANFSVLTGINGVTAANLSGEELSVRDDGTFTIVVSPDAPPANPEKGMNYLQAPANSTILAIRNTLSDWNSDKPMTLTIEQVEGPPSSLFSQIGGFAIPFIGETVVKNPALLQLVSVIPAFDRVPLLLSSTETALLMLVTGISGENTYMSVATATGEPNVLSEPAHNAQFLSTQLQSAGYFQLKDDEAMIITVDPGDAEYFVVPVTNDWTITNDTRNQQTSLNNSQAIKNADGTYTIVVSKNDPGVANWVSTGGLNQGTISMRFQGVDPDATNMPTVTTRVVKLSEVEGIVTDPDDPNYNPDQLDYDRAQQIAERQAGYDLRYTV